MKRLFEAVLVLAVAALAVLVARQWQARRELAERAPGASAASHPGVDAEDPSSAPANRERKGVHPGSVVSTPMIKLSAPKPRRSAAGVPAPLRPLTPE